MFEDFHITRPNLVSDSTINYRNSCERFKYVKQGWYLLKSPFLFTEFSSLVKLKCNENCSVQNFGQTNYLLVIFWLFLSKLICWRIVYKHLRARNTKSTFICVWRFICEIVNVNVCQWEQTHHTPWHMSLFRMAEISQYGKVL